MNLGRPTGYETHCTVGLVTKGPPFCSSEHVCFSIPAGMRPCIAALAFSACLPAPPHELTYTVLSARVQETSRNYRKLPPLDQKAWPKNYFGKRSPSLRTTSITLDPTGSHSGSHPEIADSLKQNVHFLNSITLDPTGSHPEIADSLKQNVHFLNCVTHWIPLDPTLDPIRFEGSL